AQSAAAARGAERIRSAERAVAARASAQHSAAYSAALARTGRAQAAYDKARLAYAGAKADYDATVMQADRVRDLGTAATATAQASRRTLATLVRATLQQSGPEAVDVLLASNSTGTDLLARLATLEALEKLTNSLDEMKGRVDADTKRERTLQDQDTALRAVIEAIPLSDTRLTMEDAQRELDAAAAEVAELAASTPVALTLTPLPDPAPAAGADDFGGRLRGQLSSEGWAAPSVGSLTDAFGPRPDKPLPEVNDFHSGTDIGAACGAAVYAASAGVVATAAPLGTYGNWILIDHGNGIATGYAHLAEGQTLVSPGEAVIAGQVIASIGSTGSATGCHLHFEVRRDGTAVDAQPFLVQRGVRFG
ncbi:M23 family metallopeptidase, partial [Cryobacterium sp. TMT3-29-2]|uniref:M23 family metallopeptidase n=1 Tax=Cryobacterium sp. TMT3-29-2 TaxID=2555867 RepID=UPI00107381E6